MVNFAGACRAIAFVSYTTLIYGQTFRFSTMRWTSCYAIVGTQQDGFYDPLFPLVCSERTNPLKVAVTVEVAFAVNGNSQTSMLQTASQDVANFQAGICFLAVLM